MINLKKIKSNILQVSVISYLVFGCGDGNQQNPRITPQTPQTPQDKEKKQIQLLQKKVKDKLKASDIKLEDLNITAIPKKKEKLNNLLTQIENINERIKSADQFFNQRAKFKKEQKKLYNNNKLIKKSYKEIAKVITERTKLEKEANNILGNPANNNNILNKTNEDLQNIIKKNGKEDNNKKKIQEFIDKKGIDNIKIDKIKKENYSKYINLINDLNKIFPEKNAHKVYNAEGIEYTQDNIKNYFDLKNSKEIEKQVEKYELLKNNEQLLNYMIKDEITDLNNAQELYKKSNTVIKNLIARAKIMKELTDLGKSNLQNNKNKYYQNDNFAKKKESNILKLITKAKTKIQRAKNLEQKYKDLENKYLYDFSTKTTKEFDDNDINNLRQKFEEKNIDKTKQLQIIKTMLEISSETKELTELEQVPGSEKKGLYITELNKSPKLLQNSKQIIDEFKLFKNLDENNIQQSLNKALTGIKTIKSNAEKIKELFTRKVLKERNKENKEVNFDNSDKVKALEAIKSYTTIEELTKTNKDKSKVSKLIEIQDGVDFFRTKYSGNFNLEKIENYLYEKINDDFPDLDTIIKRLNNIKKIVKQATNITETQNNNKSKLTNIVTYIIDNQKFYSLNEVISTPEIKENNITSENYKNKIIETFIDDPSTQSESFFCYNQKYKETIFNRMTTINPENKSHIKLKIEGFIKLMKEVYELNDKDQLIKAQFNKIKEFENTNSFEKFFKVYVNLNRESDVRGNISHAIANKLITIKNNSDLINKYFEILQVLTSHGLNLTVKSNTLNNSFIEMLKADNTDGKWVIEFEDNDTTLKTLKFEKSKYLIAQKDNIKE